MLPSSSLHDSSTAGSIIAIMVLYYAVAYWNSFFNALIYLSDADKYPLQMIMRDILITGQALQADVSDPEAYEQMLRIAQSIKYGVIIVSSLPEFIHQIRYFGEEPFYEFLLTCLIMAFGFALIFWHEAIVMIAIGALMLAIPCLKILCSNAKTAMLRTQLPVIALGVALLVVGPAKSAEVLFDVGGYLIIALALLYCLYFLIFRLPRKKSKAIRSEKKNIGDE